MQAAPKNAAVRSAVSRRSTVVVRAAGGSSSYQPPKPKLLSEIPASERFFTDDEWEATLNKLAKQAAPAGSPAGAVAAVAVPANKTVSFGEAMAFAGPAPETVNGRLAMLGFAAALATEIATGEPVTQQLAEAPTTILAGSAAFVLASLFPIVKGANLKEAFGPFSPEVELLNGRAAMLGFGILLYLEAAKNVPFFTFSA